MKYICLNVLWVIAVSGDLIVVVAAVAGVAAVAAALVTLFKLGLISLNRMV